jgi:hypothetical protein
MVVSIAARGAVGVRKEASFASGGGIDSWQVIESCGIEKSNIHILQDRIRNTPEQVNAPFSHVIVSGPITFPVSPQTPNVWWECGIGGSGPYTPSIPLNSMAMEIQEGQIGTVYTSGDMITRLELSSRKGDILRCSVNVEGADMSPRASSTPSFASGDIPYLHSECAFTLDGVANQDVEAFSVSKENNNITDLYGSTPRRREIPATKAVVSGSISILFSDTGMRNRFFDRRPSRLTAQYVRGGDSFTIELNSIVYTSDGRPLDGQTSFILETLNFSAYIDDTAQNSIKITVV